MGRTIIVISLAMIATLALLWATGSAIASPPGGKPDGGEAAPPLAADITANPLDTYTAIAAGYHHTCALTAGGVRCWGYNLYGQLGDGTTTDRNTPVDVSGLTSGVAAIAGGFYHTCALTTGGGVKCWGYNGYSQLGDGTTTGRTTPVDVSGLTSGVAAIAGGFYHTCALTTGGGVKCWGYNFYGQLGDGTTTNRTTPVDVSGLTSGVVAIAGDGYHTCALTTGSGVKCWGRNSYGQLGDGTTTDRNTPMDVSGLTSGVTAIASGGYHTCAVTTGGGVKCWGYNGYGQLGDGTWAQRTTPVDVSGLTSGVAAIAGGGYHTCALTTGGGVKCWGDNGYGQLGDGTTTMHNTPVDVSGLTSGAAVIAGSEYHTVMTFTRDLLLSGVAAIAGGGQHTCALTMGGGVKCWGSNEHGQLGNGQFGYRIIPGDVSGLTSGVAAIAGGFYHTCALTTGGGVKCWGDNFYGQLGDGTTTGRTTPVDVSGLTSGVAAIAGGYYHTCALTTGGGVKCWGRNSYSQLGDGTTTNRTTPVDVSGLTSGVVAIAGGGYHTCALTTGGGVKCWGRNSYGQLGDGTTTDRNTPVDVSGLTSEVTAIASGGHHACAVTTGGGVKCWGYNFYGQLGDGTTTNRTTPVDVSGLTSGVTALTGGFYHTCALTTGGGVKCWGDNGYGQLGNGTWSQGTTPVDVSGLTSGAAAIAGGGYHTCALTAGGVKCWGYNFYGQLGDGTTTMHNTPADVSGLTSGMAAIANGYHHTCAVTTGGGVKCWGYNLYGQLGNGEFGYSTTPVDVAGSAVPPTSTPTTTPPTLTPTTPAATTTPTVTPTPTATPPTLTPTTPAATATPTATPTRTLTPTPTVTGTAITAGLFIHKAANVDVVAPGDRITYTLRYSNSSSLNVVDQVRIGDHIPANITYLGCTGGLNCARQGERVFWYLGSVAPRTGGVVKMAVQVLPDLPDGTVITNTAWITAPNLVEPVFSTVTTLVKPRGVYLPLVLRAYAPGSELAYDDGAMETTASWETGKGFAVRFTPSVGRVQVMRARYYLLEPRPIQVHVWDANHTDLITPFTANTTQEGWNDVNLSAYNLTVSGDFYVGFLHLENYRPTLGVDTSATDRRSFEVDGAYWEQQASDYLIRVVIVPR